MALTATQGKRWIPNPGPQTDAYLTLADETFYGGAAGGGKTDLGCGLALNEHHTSAIFRREGTDLKGIQDRLLEINGGYDGFRQSPIRELRLPDGRSIELASCPHERDMYGQQGRPRDLYVIDEVTQFPLKIVKYITGWNRPDRSPNKAQRCRIVYTGNPPSTVEGAWIKVEFAPWLDPTFSGYGGPAQPGELRYFTSDPRTGDTIWVPKEWVGRDASGNVIRPKSRTFIPAKLHDNPHYGAGTDAGQKYRATLAALPEPLRTQLLEGDFNVAEQDRANQVIPTAWVRAAQARWKPDGDLATMISIGADVAQGGGDKFVLAPRHRGDHIAKLHVLPASVVEDGPKAAAFIVEKQRHGAQINVDMGGGYGTSVRDHLKHANVSVWEYNGAEKSTRDSKSGLKYANMRAQLAWNMREILDPAGDRRPSLPPDEEMVADLCALTWELTPSGIKIVSNDKVREMLGRSPDKGVGVILAFGDPRDDVAYDAQRNQIRTPDAVTRDPFDW